MRTIERRGVGRGKRERERERETEVGREDGGVCGREDGGVCGEGPSSVRTVKRSCGRG